MTAACIAANGVPERLDPRSEFRRMGPDPLHNHELGSLAEYIGGALEAFDGIQRALGLPLSEPAKYECVATGRCNACEGKLRGTSRKIGTKRKSQ